MMPRAGGQYVFLREAYSPMFGFLFGWAMFLVVQTGTIAAVAVAFAKFLGVFFPGSRPTITSSSRSISAATPSASRLNSRGARADRVPDVGQHAGPETRQVDPEHVHLHQDGRAHRPDRGGPVSGQQLRERGLDVVVVGFDGQRLGSSRPDPGPSAGRTDGSSAPARPGDDRAAFFSVGLEQRDVHRRRGARPGPHASSRTDPRRVGRRRSLLAGQCGVRRHAPVDRDPACPPRPGRDSRDGGHPGPRWRQDHGRARS